MKYILLPISQFSTKVDETEDIKTWEELTTYIMELNIDEFSPEDIQNA